VISPIVIDSSRCSLSTSERRSRALTRAMISAEGKRLRDVVVGPRVRARDLVELLILGLSMNDRHARGLADFLARFDAVEQGEHDVEDDQVRLLDQGEKRRKQW